MGADRRQFLTGTLLAAGGGMLPRLSLDANLATPQIVTLRGQILCLTEELETQFQVVPDCQTRGHLYADLVLPVQPDVAWRPVVCELSRGPQVVGLRQRERRRRGRMG